MRKETNPSGGGGVNFDIIGEGAGMPASEMSTASDSVNEGREVKKGGKEGRREGGKDREG